MRSLLGTDDRTLPSAHFDPFPTLETAMICSFGIFLAAFSALTTGYVVRLSPVVRRSILFSTETPIDPRGQQQAAPTTEDEGFFQAITLGVNVIVKRMSEGDDFKQAFADALAGPTLDVVDANHKIDALIDAHPCVVFSWTVSPFSTKAKALLDQMGVTYHAVELDKPWKDGNPLRAALGRRVGRTSVPAVFINGYYVGGFEDGPSADCPGLMSLLAAGRLRPLLIEAGALSPAPDVDFVPPFARRQLADVVAKAKENVRPYTVIPAGTMASFSAPAESNAADDECPSDGCDLP